MSVMGWVFVEDGHCSKCGEWQKSTCHAMKYISSFHFSWALLHYLLAANQRCHLKCSADLKSGKTASSSSVTFLFCYRHSDVISWSWNWTLNCFTVYYTIFTGACLCLKVISMFSGLKTKSSKKHMRHTAHCGCALCSVSIFLESHSF